MTTVKYFHSAMSGAPVLTGQSGTMINLLDKCLVDGFGKSGPTDTLDSIVVNGNVATASRSGGHPFEVDTIVSIAGATPSGLNGEKRVLSVTTTTFTFDATGITDQTATGTIISKLAPSGWSKPHSSGATLAAYKSTDVASTGMYLYIDDSNATNARVLGRETMSSISDTTGGAFPTSIQVSGGAYWGKSASADTAARAWIIISDASAFYIAVQNTGTVGYCTYMFGDIVSYKSTDPYRCGIVATSSTSASVSTPGTSGHDFAYADGNTTYVAYLARGTSGLGGSTNNRKNSLILNGTYGFFSGGTSTFPAYPNPANNELLLSRFYAIETSPTCIARGEYPGVFFVPQNVGPSTFAVREKVSNISGLSGRKIMGIANSTGVIFIDITGPWR